MDQKAFGNSADKINSTSECDTDPPVEKDVSCNGTIKMQAISFADSDSTQHSTAGTAGAAKALVEIVTPFSYDIPTETCLNKNDNTQTHESMVSIKCYCVHKVEFLIYVGHRSCPNGP